MNTLLISLGIFSLYFASFLHSTEGVRCYQCANIEGVTNRDLNPNCASNVMDSSIHTEEGAACVKAEGEIDGQPFIVRRAFLPGTKTLPHAFPKDQAALPCDDYRVMSFGVAKVTTVSDRRVSSLTSCTVCNNGDDCNAATGVVGSSSVFGLAVIVAVVTRFLY